MYYEARMIKSNGQSLQEVDRERERHFQRYNSLAIKARNIDLPDIDTYENLGQAANRLKKGKNLHDKFFEGLGFKESIKY